MEQSGGRPPISKPISAPLENGQLNRRARKKLAHANKKNSGLLEALSTLVERSSKKDAGEAILMQRLRRIVQVANRGDLQARGAGRNGGGSSSKTSAANTGGNGGNGTSKTAAANQRAGGNSGGGIAKHSFYPPTKVKSGDGKTGAAKNVSSPTPKAAAKPKFEPTTLVQIHWHGQVTTLKDAADVIAKLPNGGHAVIGVAKSWADPRLPKSAPEGATITIVSSKPCAGATSIRSPALDKAGVPKVAQIFYKQLSGKDGTDPITVVQPQAWTSVPAKSALGDEIKLKKLQVLIFETMVEPLVWKAIKVNVLLATRQWLRRLGLDDDDLHDVYQPRAAVARGAAVACFISVREAVAEKVVLTSGSEGFLTRPFVEGNVTKTFDVNWQDQSNDENGIAYLKRCRGLAASAAEGNKGLGWSDTGSLGLRVAVGSKPAAWIVRGVPYWFTRARCKKWLEDEGWLEVTVGEYTLRKRSKGDVACFRFRGSHTTIEQIHLVDVEGEMVEIEPWRPKDKKGADRWKTTKVASATYLEASLRAEASTKPNTSATVSQTDVVVEPPAEASERLAQMRRREGGDTADQAAADQADSAAAQTSNVLSALGLRTVAVSKDGACFFHALAWWCFS